MPKATLAQTLQYTIPTAEATTMEDSGTHTEAPTQSLEVCVSYIAQCQWNEDTNAPSWLTYYSGNIVCSVISVYIVMLLLLLLCLQI